MKHCAWKLLTLTMALAMLPSSFALTKDGLPELTIDGPIEIEGKIGGVDGDTQNQSGELEIVLDGSEGLPDLGADPGVGNLDLNLDLEAESLELVGEALAPATNIAVDTPETVSTWAGLQAALNGAPKADESTKPTQYQLVGNITAPEGSGPITVPVGRNVLLCLNNCTIDRKLSTATEDGCVIKVLGGLCVQSMDSAGGEPPMIKGGWNTGNGGGVYVADDGHFTVSNGIKISENKAKSGGGVYVANGGEFTMTGGTISGNSAGAGVYVAKGGEFTMTGGTISGNDERGVSVVGGTFTMEKGTISGNSAGAGGGVFVTEDGTFTMNDGCEISGNTSSGSSGYGAGVHVVYGTFTMKGGTIRNNRAGDCGGGVYVSSTKGDKKGKFTMTGGTISNNTAKNEGGGVSVNEGGTFTMDDGCEISGNTATNGGGVQFMQGTFTMYGGAIRENTATRYNGGVGVYATFTMKGGTISNNSAGEHGGGVGLVDYGTIKLSGEVEISGNKTDVKDKNVVLISEPKNEYNNSIVIEGTLSNQTPIGVSCGYEMTGPQVFTSGLPEYGAVGNFTSEQGDGYVILPVPQTISGAGEAVLCKTAKVTFDANGGKGAMEAQTVIQKWALPLNANAFTWRGHSYSGWNTAADGSGTGYADGADIKLTGDIALYAQWTRHPITVAAIPGQTYGGAAIKPAPVVRDQTTGETLAEGVDYAVTYTDNVNVGTATATVTGKGDYAGKVNVQFTINRKILTVTADNLTKVEGEKDPELTYKADGLAEGDKLEGKLAREEGEKPGTYKITQGTLDNKNYKITFVEGTLTIKAKSEDKPEEKPEDTGAGDIDTEVEKGEDVPEMKVGGLTDETAKDLATKEELDRVEKGEKLVVYLTATNIDDTVSKADKELVTAAITAKDKGGKVAQYLDFSMFKQIGKDKPTRLTDLKGHAITITITVPKAFRAPAGVKRTFYVVRVHDGEAQIVGTGTGNSVKVSTDKFSTYALTYVDETEPEPEPEPKPTVKPTVKADYTLLGQLTVSGSGNKALKLTWTKVKDADGYDVYFARCGKDFKLKATVSASASRCVRFTGLKKRECYKAYVRAWQIVNGKKVYIGKKSPELHAITGGYDKDHCNTKSVKLSRSTLSLKVGKSKTVKASLKGVKSGKKPVEHARKVRWYSSNTSVATVNQNGKIKAVGKGTCTVYAIANNGIRSSVKVTVK